MGNAPAVNDTMAVGEVKTPFAVRLRGRRLALAGSAVLAVLVLALSAVLLVAAASDHGGQTQSASRTDGGNDGPDVLGARVTPTPTPTPLATTAPGGEAPIGPGSAVPPGQIAENRNVSKDFLVLRDSLAAEIEAYRAEVGRIEVAVAVTDLQTGQTISVGGNDVHRTGCTINMFALLAAVGEFEAGRASPGQVSYAIKSGIGGSYPPQVKQFLQTIFGNHQTGVARAQEMMTAWGMQESLYDHVPYYGSSGKNNQFTALETDMILVKLFRGQLFDAEWTGYTLKTLRDIASYLQYMLPGRLPASATVAHKIGYYWDSDGWVNNDAGIVTFKGSDGKEKAYAITYLSQKGRTEYIGYSFAATLSRVAWDWFAAKYGAQTAPPPPPAPPKTPAPPPPPPPPAPTPAPHPTVVPTPPPPPTPTPVPTAPPTPVPTPTPGVTPTATP